MSYSNKISGIYTITNLVNSKIYVGLSCNIKAREWLHFNQLSNNKHRNSYLQKSFNKHGRENFKFEILEECSIDLLASQENYWCNMLDTHNPKYGYNDQPTHPLNRPKSSLATKEKLRIINTGREVKQETKDKLRQINLGKKQSTETIDKRRQKLIGSKRSEATRLKLSINRYKNPLKPNLGKKLSKETIEKLRLKRIKPICQYDLNGNFIQKWESAVKAANDLGLSVSNICSCCSGKRNHVGGFKWKRHTDNTNNVD